MVVLLLSWIKHRFFPCWLGSGCKGLVTGHRQWSAVTAAAEGSTSQKLERLLKSGLLVHVSGQAGLVMQVNMNE